MVQGDTFIVKWCSDASYEQIIEFHNRVSYFFSLIFMSCMFRPQHEPNLSNLDFQLILFNPAWYNGLTPVGEFLIENIKKGFLDFWPIFKLCFSCVKYCRCIARYAYISPLTTSIKTFGTLSLVELLVNIFIKFLSFEAWERLWFSYGRTRLVRLTLY